MKIARFFGIVFVLAAVLFMAEASYAYTISGHVKIYNSILGKYIPVGDVQIMKWQSPAVIGQGPTLAAITDAKTGSFSFSSDSLCSTFISYFFGAKKECMTFTPGNQSLCISGDTGVEFIAADFNPTISGKVIDQAGNGIPGVTMTGLGTSTDSSGYYSVHTSCPFSGTVTPTKSCYVFTPGSYSNVTTDQTNQNYTGTALTYTISGTVTQVSGMPVGSQILGLPGTPSTNLAGFYTATVGCGWSGTATPSGGTGFTYSPPSRSYSNVLADQLNQNYTSYPPIRISGYVKTAALAVIPGVAMAGLPGNIITDASGSYSASVPQPFTGTVTPTLNCYIFSLPSISYTGVTTDQTNQNYTGTMLTYTISGFVKTATMAIQGEMITGLPGSIMTDASGYYSATVLCGWSGTAAPSPLNYHYTPASIVYNNVTANHTNQNYTGIPNYVTISGYVKTAADAAIPGVIMSGLPGNPTTDASGIYTTLKSVPTPFTGTVIPTLTCYAFSPASFPYSGVIADQTYQNYTGTKLTYTISGYIKTASGAAIAGVTINGLPGPPNTDASGLYTAVVDCGSVSTAVPSKPGYSFSPASIPYSNVAANQTNQNYTGTPVPLTISGYVKTAGGAPIPGVVMSNLPGNPLTNASGFYTASMASPFSGIVTPTLACSSFSPPSITYAGVTSDQSNQNYTGNLLYYTISGYVKTAAGEPIAGVGIVGLPIPCCVGNPSTDATGFYTTDVPCGFTGTATPTKTGYSFSPLSISYSNVAANQTNQNYTGTRVPLTISGYVKTAAGAPIPGVVMSGLPGNPPTDASGFYTASMASPFTGTVTPTLACYSFSPASSTYTGVTSDQSNQNYTGTALTYTISGYVKLAAGTPIPGVQISGLPGPPSTDASGFYSGTVSCGFSGTATPGLTGYSFSPLSTTYSSVVANQTNQNYTGTRVPLTISGYVKTGAGAPIPGVVMSGLPGNPPTNASGFYTASMASPFSGTVTPTLACYSFSPPSITYTGVTSDQSNQNYTGTALTYTISGYVKIADSSPISGVLIGGLPGNPTTDASGYYSASVACGWSGTASPSKSNYSFAPTSIAYSNVTADKTNQNYTGTQGFTSIFISGYVKTAAGAPISGVTISGLPGSPSTDASGFYSSSVTPPFTGTATPVKTCYAFNPASIPYIGVTSDQTNQNYTGTALSYTISGYVKTGAGAAISGVTMTGLPGNPNTDASGFYSVTVDCGWSGTITPTKTCYAFSPATTTYSGVSSNQSTDYSGTAGSITITGRVRTAAGAGVGGVVMTGLPGNPTTLEDGSYTASVACGWSGTVTPTKTCYTFNPASTTYSNTTASKNTDYTASASTLTLSGYVKTAAGGPIAGVTMTGLPGNPSTDASGYYSAGVACGWSGAVTPTKACYSFDPPSTTYTSVSGNHSTDYKGTLGSITLSGYVRTASGSPISDVLMSGLPGNPVTDANGFYTASLSCGWSGTVTPTKTGYSFDPASATFTNLSIGKTTDFTGTATKPVTEDFAISLHQGGGGWVEIRGLESSSFAHKSWAQVTWSAYNASVGEAHAAYGDIDADGRKELVIGLGTGSGGWLEVLDDASTGFAHKAWIQINWSAYNGANGLTNPTIGDVDNDGKNEIVVGLGTGGAGYLEVFGDASTNFAHKAWIHFNWPGYNELNGSTIPVIGDVDGDGKNEIVLGLGSGGDGYLPVLGFADNEYSQKAWPRVSWDAYNAGEGTTFPAIGDINGDGKNEIVVGLGVGGGGYVEILKYGEAAGYEHDTWVQTASGWRDYLAIGETHPACIDINGDGIKELVVGFTKGSAGWLAILGNATTGCASKAWIQIPWSGYNQANGETTPVP